MAISWLGERIMEWAAGRAFSGRRTISLLRQAGESFRDETFWPMWRRAAGYAKGQAWLRTMDVFEPIPPQKVPRSSWSTRRTYKVDLRIREWDKRTGETRVITRSLATDTLDTPANLGVRAINNWRKQYGLDEMELEWEFEALAGVWEGAGPEKWL